MNKKPEPFILYSMLAIVILWSCWIVLAWFVEDVLSVFPKLGIIAEVMSSVFSLIGLFVGTWRLFRYPDKYTGTGLLPFLILFLISSVQAYFISMGKMN